MVQTIISINTKGDKNLPTEKIIIDIDSNFFQEGDIIQIPGLTNKSFNLAAVKVIKVTKQIDTGVASYTPKIIVQAEKQT